MSRKKVAVALLLVVGVGVWVGCPDYLWVGGYDLTVRVSSDHGPLRSVICAPCGRRESAEDLLEHVLRPGAGPWVTEDEPHDGRPLAVSVHVSGRDSMCGLQRSRFQDRFLVVIAVLPDGRTGGKVVDIPDGRASREVSVTLP